MHVVERGAGGVELDIFARRTAGLGIELDALLGGERADDFRRQPQIGDVVLAARHQRAHRRRLEAITVAHLVGRVLGEAEEIVRELDHDGLGLRVLALDLVGAGAGVMRGHPRLAIVAELAMFAVGLVGHHRLGVDHRQADERRQEGRIGLGQRELDGERVDGLRLLDAAGEEAREALAHRDHAVEREDHVVGRQGIAGVKLHAVLELERVAVSVRRPFGRQQRLHAGAACLRIDQRVVDVGHQDRIGIVRRLGRIDLADGGLVQPQHAFGEGGHRQPERRCQDEGRRQGPCSQSHRIIPSLVSYRTARALDTGRPACGRFDRSLPFRSETIQRK